MCKPHFGSSFGSVLCGLAGVATLAFALNSNAADTVRYTTKFGGKVTINGTSTAHDWSMSSGIIQGSLELPAGVTLDPTVAAPAGLKAGKLEAKTETQIPVRSLKGDYSGMDDVMQQAMNAADHPMIKFVLTEMIFKEPHEAGKPLEFDTKGELIINGTTNKISFPVTMVAADKPKIKISGSTSVKMSDYKVKAPVLKIGPVAITTGDDVKIAFEWMVAQAAAK